MKNKNIFIHIIFFIWRIENELWDENWKIEAFVDFSSITIRYRDPCLGAFERANIPLKLNGLKLRKLFLVSYILNHEIYIYKFLVLSDIFGIQTLISFDLMKKIKIWAHLLLEGVKPF